MRARGVPAVSEKTGSESKTEGGISHFTLKGVGFYTVGEGESSGGGLAGTRDSDRRRALLERVCGLDDSPSQRPESIWGPDCRGRAKAFGTDNC